MGKFVVTFLFFSLLVTKSIAQEKDKQHPRGLGYIFQMFGGGYLDYQPSTLLAISGKVSLTPSVLTTFYKQEILIKVIGFSDSVLIDETFTDSSGYFSLTKLNYDKLYTVEFSYPGYYSKFIWIYTNNIPDSLREKSFYKKSIGINLNEIVNKNEINPFSRVSAIYKYAPIELASSLNKLNERDSLLKTIIVNGGIIEDLHYHNIIKPIEKQIESDLKFDFNYKNKKKLTEMELNIQIQKLEMEKIEQDKVLLNQTNKLNESEIAKEKAIAISRAKDIEILKTIQEKKDNQHQIIRNSFIAGLTGALIFLVVLYRQRNKIRKGKKQSDELLLNILPAEVADELKTKGSADAKQFDDVTVMFTDFKNFTKISEKLSPSELVAEIHECFKAFDNIISKHNIEKIKTIGDSYMCAGGLPVENKTNATDVVNAAIEIQNFMQLHTIKRKSEGKEVFEIRIGIHTGPVIAGIVGVKKFAYDIWGDTVNIASRMESSGEAGKVNISGSTYELVKDKFNCVYRGKIHAKNKGEIDMYFIEGNS